MAERGRRRCHNCWNLGTWCTCGPARDLWVSKADKSPLTLQQLQDQYVEALGPDANLELVELLYHHN